MRRLHWATIVVALLPGLREAIRTTFPVIIGAFATGHGASNDWFAGLIALVAGAFAISAYWTTRFSIEDDHVAHHTGWIFKKDRRIPLNQIQNVNIRQNVLERLFKVATVDVETAMGKGRDLKLTVLGFADAEHFREQLLGAAHLDVSTIVKSEEPVMRLSNHDLLLGAVTENHIAQFITGIFTIGGPSIGIVMNFGSKLPTQYIPLVFAGALMIGMVGSWIWGAGSYYLKYGGFTVHITENIFRIQYGLLSKIQLAIRPGRIEYLNLTATIPQRLMGRASLHVGTAATFGEAGVLAPMALFVPKEAAYRGASEVIPGLDLGSLAWQPFHPTFYRVRLARSFFFFCFWLAGATWISSLGRHGAASFIWLLFGLIVTVQVCGTIALLLARAENGFAITDDALIVRQGYYHQAINAMPIHRMENVATTQPWWWKKRGAATLIVQAMKHRVHVGALPVEAIETLMTLWREKIHYIDSLPEAEVLVEDEPVVESFVDDLSEVIEPTDELSESASDAEPQKPMAAP